MTLNTTSSSLDRDDLPRASFSKIIGYPDLLHPLALPKAASRSPALLKRHTMQHQSSSPAVPAIAFLPSDPNLPPAASPTFQDFLFKKIFFFEV